MPKFFVRQRRAMWVCVIQEIEADDEEAAEEEFLEGFDPQHMIIEGHVQRMEHGPITVWDAETYPTPKIVQEQD